VTRAEHARDGQRARDQRGGRGRAEGFGSAHARSFW
jgi:hypothetical protein